MKTKLKTPGFTILEMIIAMILSIIIIAFAYSAFKYILGVWQSFDDKQKKNINMLLFNKTMIYDIENTRCIFRNDRAYKFIRTTDTIHYYFDTCIFRRVGTATDTFHISTENLTSEYILLMNGTNVVKSITFNITKPYEIDNVCFKKYYSSEELIAIQHGL